VGISGRVVLDEAVKLLKQASLNKTVSFDVSRQTSGKNADINELLQRFTERSEMMQKYVEAYRKYCWPVNSIDDLKLAPFHILATEGKCIRIRIIYGTWIPLLNTVHRMIA